MVIYNLSEVSKRRMKIAVSKQKVIFVFVQAHKIGLKVLRFSCVLWQVLQAI